ncbi:ABC ATP-binding, putative [Babesia ovis]|uniref:ABC ATP-binding, putative n=1 Tax=Babesia ovis TaxID=5869 RepID=A0A9W5T9U8_BABOV|nr:ABC ATP-binding, putative [Babesia ovis]
MYHDSLLTPRKRHGRRYQFDPQSVSAHYHIVADRVRQIVNRDRANLKHKSKLPRIARRALFERLCSIGSGFIRPESLDELESRATSINQQLSIVSQTKATLESILHITEKIHGNTGGPVTFTSTPATTVEEEDAEMASREPLRQHRKQVFLQNLMERSQAEVQRRKDELEARVLAIQQRDAEEAAEEEHHMLACDRKLLLSGVYRSQSRSQAIAQ